MRDSEVGERLIEIERESVCVSVCVCERENSGMCENE